MPATMVFGFRPPRDLVENRQELATWSPAVELTTKLSATAAHLERIETIG
jgi:hypothetical protein